MSQPKLINQVHSAIRVNNYNPRTEEAYLHWIKQFIFLHNKRHRMKWANLKSSITPRRPKEMSLPRHRIKRSDMGRGWLQLDTIR